MGAMLVPKKNIESRGAASGLLSVQMPNATREDREQGEPSGLLVSVWKIRNRTAQGFKAGLAAGD